MNDFDSTIQKELDDIFETNTSKYDKYNLKLKEFNIPVSEESILDHNYSETKKIIKPKISKQNKNLNVTIDTIDNNEVLLPLLNNEIFHNNSNYKVDKEKINNTNELLKDIQIKIIDNMNNMLESHEDNITYIQYALPSNILHKEYDYLKYIDDNENKLDAGIKWEKKDSAIILNSLKSWTNNNLKENNKLNDKNKLRLKNINKLITLLFED